MKHSSLVIRFGIFIMAVGLLIGLLFWGQDRDRQKINPNLLPVAASFYPYGEFVRAVGGTHVSVQVITSAGVEPHDFEPTPQDILRVNQVKLFIYNGGGLDLWAERIEPDLADVAIIRGVDNATLRTNPEDPQTRDPHIWLDPVIAQKIIDQIVVALTTLDPGNQSDYQKNAASYRNELRALDEAYQTGLALCAKRAIVTAHAAFGYLTDRYRLEQIPIAGLLEDEPSPAQLAQIATLTKAKGIKYIFTETLTSPRLSETIAKEVGAQILVLNPLEGLTDREQATGATYLSVMRANLAQLRLALDCQS